MSGGAGLRRCGGTERRPRRRSGGIPHLFLSTVRLFPGDGILLPLRQEARTQVVPVALVGLCPPGAPFLARPPAPLLVDVKEIVPTPVATASKPSIRLRDVRLTTACPGGTGASGSVSGQETSATRFTTCMLHQDLSRSQLTPNQEPYIQGLNSGEATRTDERHARSRGLTRNLPGHLERKKEEEIRRTRTGGIHP